MKQPIIAFDIFGTLVDMAGVNRDELRAYANHIGRDDWSPLRFPESWLDLPAFPDVAEGLERLRSLYLVVSLSNAPLGFTARLAKRAGFRLDAIVPLEMAQVYKPDPRAYAHLLDVFDVAPHSVTMVTANKSFGDLEGASALGMGAAWIRGESEIRDVCQLAELHGC